MNRFELESLLVHIGTPSGNVFILGDLETGPEIGTSVKGQMPSVFQLLQSSGKIMLFRSLLCLAIKSNSKINQINLWNEINSVTESWFPLQMVMQVYLKAPSVSRNICKNRISGHGLITATLSNCPVNWGLIKIDQNSSKLIDGLSTPTSVDLQ